MIFDFFQLFFLYVKLLDQLSLKFLSDIFHSAVDTNFLVETESDSRHSFVRHIFPSTFLRLQFYNLNHPSFEQVSMRGGASIKQTYLDWQRWSKFDGRLELRFALS